MSRRHTFNYSVLEADSTEFALSEVEELPMPNFAMCTKAFTAAINNLPGWRIIFCCSVSYKFKPSNIWVFNKGLVGNSR